MQVKSDAQGNRAEVYQTTVDVLAPEITKLRNLYKFQEGAISRFADEIRHLAHPEVIKVRIASSHHITPHHTTSHHQGFMSQTALACLGKMIAMFAVLNELKNVKACLNNDFSLYRRSDPPQQFARHMSSHHARSAAGFLKGKINVDAAEIVEERNMSFFFATQNSLVLKLREVLEKIAKYVTLTVHISR